MKKFVLLTSILVFSGLLTGCGGGGAPALPDISSLSIDDWDVYGTAAAEDDILIVGDSLGNDPYDSDEDNNTWNKLADGSLQYDYDVIVSKNVWSLPITLAFQGTLRKSAYGYNDIGLALKSDHFTGRASEGTPVEFKAFFSLNWNETDHLQVYVPDRGYQTTAVSISDDLTGNYKIVWDGTTVTFYFNDDPIGEYALSGDADGDYTVFIKSYDQPLDITSLSVTTE